MTQTITIESQDNPVAVEVWENGSGMDRLIKVIEVLETTDIQISDSHYLVVRQL
jgi:hypothetical protein